MNTPQNNSAQTEQTKPKTINDLHKAFAALAFSYGMVTREDSCVSGASLEYFESDCEKLAAIANAMRKQAKAEREINTTAQAGGVA